MLFNGKKCVSLLVIAALAVSIAGCGKADTKDAQNIVSDEKTEQEDGTKQDTADKEPVEQEKSDGESSDINVYEKEFGTYTVDAQWEELQDGDMFIYQEKGTEADNNADYIALGYYENPYSLDQIDIIYDGIENQLLQSLEANGVGELSKGSYSTEQGYNLLIFGFEVEDVDVTQFYIVGEKKHCLVQTVTHGESEERNKVIQDMINSFVWSEQ